ncbi:MAG: PAS domain-containing protein [Hyphomicrobiales bacterium]
MGYPTVHALFNYWNQQRNGSAAPERADIHPGDIRSILPEVFLLERSADGRFYYRLAGTLLCQNARRELKGQRPLAHFTDLDRRKMQIALTQVAEKGLIFKADILGISAKGRSVEQQWIVLPLRKGDGPFARLIGACVTVEEPFWLGRDPIVRNSILSARMISTQNERAMRDLKGGAPLPFTAEVRPNRGANPIYAMRGRVERPNRPLSITDLQARIEQQFGRRAVTPSRAGPILHAGMFSNNGDLQTPNFNVVPLSGPEKRVQHLTVFSGGKEG